MSKCQDLVQHFLTQDLIYLFGKIDQVNLPLFDQRFCKDFTKSYVAPALDHLISSGQLLIWIQSAVTVLPQHKTIRYINYQETKPNTTIY